LLGGKVLGAKVVVLLAVGVRVGVVRAAEEAGVGLMAILTITTKCLKLFLAMTHQPTTTPKRFLEHGKRDRSIQLALGLTRIACSVLLLSPI
jgi:hypothetical protein